MILEGLHRNPLNPHTDSWISGRPHVFSGDIVALNMVARTLQGATPVETHLVRNAVVVHLFRSAEDGLLACAWFFGDGQGVGTEMPVAVGRAADIYGNPIAARRMTIDSRPVYLFPDGDETDDSFAASIRAWKDTS